MICLSIVAGVGQGAAVDTSAADDDTADAAGVPAAAEEDSENDLAPVPDRIGPGSADRRFLQPSPKPPPKASFLKSCFMLCCSD